MCRAQGRPYRPVLGGDGDVATVFGRRHRGDGVGRNGPAVEFADTGRETEKVPVRAVAGPGGLCPWYEAFAAGIGAICYGWLSRKFGTAGTLTAQPHEIKKPIDNTPHISCNGFRGDLNVVNWEIGCPPLRDCPDFAGLAQIRQTCTRICFRSGYAPVHRTPNRQGAWQGRLQARFRWLFIDNM